MSVQSDIAEITGLLNAAEEANREGRRALRRLHNRMARALADNGAALGLGDEEVVAMGGGTDKDDDGDDNP